ncbi:hypothetical protein KY345_02815, partial [Candidatus Woesearchaeota archaeon]|nr:hypothetical protein [Candidatus Woesearchaeota archaeon]
MKAVHSWKNLSIEKEVEDNTGFLLANKNGGYCSFTFPNISRYNGFFVFEKELMFRILESIDIKDSGKLKQLTNTFYSAEAEFENCKVNFFFPSSSNSLVVEFDKPREIDLLFDIRRSYDNDDKEREYKVDIMPGKAVISYRKRKKGIIDYGIFAALRAIGKIEKIDEWVKKEYPLDKKRSSSPFEWYPYRCLNLKAKKLVITACSDRKKAERESARIFSSAKKLAEKERAVIESFDFPKKIPLNISFSYLSCLASLKGLKYDNSLFAGLPWYFQNWTRDTAVSLKALIDIGEFKPVKEIIFSLFSLLDYDGNMKSRVGDIGSGGLNSADALGWTCLRCSQFISALKKKNLLRKYLTKKEEEELAEKIEHSVFLITKFKTKDGLAVNNEQETWMDTKYGDDTRAGSRIEIQALRLALYRFAYEFTKKKEFRDSEEQLKELVYKNFWNMKYLDDGKDDFTVRPNIFLAAYAYPDILRKEKWL